MSSMGNSLLGTPNPEEEEVFHTGNPFSPVHILPERLSTLLAQLVAANRQVE
jgi:hypothetical protein